MGMYVVDGIPGLRIGLVPVYCSGSCVKAPCSSRMRVRESCMAGSND